MPRVVRDYDEEIEPKNCIRKTRASTAANILDSPLRRNTRRNKPLSIVESSPESLDDSNIPVVGRTTRSRVATLDKGMATTIAKSLRSRKISGSSDVSETIEVENDVIEKRVTRRNKIVQSTVVTPTKANLRSRNVRAGSEAKSTPPVSRNKRVTRSNSVDPVSNLNESSGTPIKRKTRASIVPTEPTVVEVEEINNKACKSLDCTVIEINENDSDNSSKEKSIKNSLNTTNDTNKEMSIKESFTDSKKFVLDSPKKFQENFTCKSKTFNENIEESTKKSFEILSINSTLESSKLKININKNEIETDVPISSKYNYSLSNDPLKCKRKNNITNISDDSDLNTYESDYINVDELTESSSTDESIILISNENDKNTYSKQINLNIKDSYVKLDRTYTIEKLMHEKIDKNKDIDEKTIDLSNNDSTSKDNEIVNAKNPIVLVNDFIKHEKVCNVKVIPSTLKNSEVNIANSKSNLNYKDDTLASINNNNHSFNSISIDDKKNCLVANANKNEKEKLITIANHNETENYTYINDSDDETEKSISENKNPNKLEHFIIENEFNNEKINLHSVNISNEISNLISVNEKNDKKENLILENKNTRSPENFVDRYIINNKIDNSLLIHKNENQIVNKTLAIKSDNAEHSASLSPLNDITKVLVSVNGQRDEITTALHSTKFDKILHICNEKNNVISKKQDNKLNSPSVLISSKFDDPLNKSVSIKKNVKKSSNISYHEDNEYLCSAFTNQFNKLYDSDDLNDKSDCMSYVIKHTNEMETDQKCAEPIPENVINNINNEAILESSELNMTGILDETDTDSKQSKICGVDKNSVSSAVTDTDGENASTPTKVEETNKFNEQEKTKEKSNNTKPVKNIQKRKSKADDSDSNDSTGDLFQDILADEWFNEKKQKSSKSEHFVENQDKSEITVNNSSIITKNASVIEDCMDEENNVSNTNNNRKSFNEKEKLNKSLQQKSNDEIVNEEVNESVSKKTRISLEKRRESNHLIEFNDSKSKMTSSEIENSNQPTTESEIDSDKDENKSTDEDRRSINKSLNLNKSSSQDENTVKTNHRSNDASIDFNQSSFEQDLDENFKTSMNTSKSSMNTSKNSMNNSKTSMNTSKTSMSNSKTSVNTSKTSMNNSKTSINNSKTSANTSKTSEKESTSDISCKLLIEQSDDNLSDEPMEIDEESNDENENEKLDNLSLNKSNQKMNNSESSHSTSNQCIFSKLSNSLNNSKKSKYLLTNNSLNNSLIEDEGEDNLCSDKVEIVEDNKSENEENHNKSEMKNRRSSNKYNLSGIFNQSNLQNKNENLQEKLSDSLNSSIKLKNNLSEKIQPPNKSSRKSLLKDQILKNRSDNEMEVEENNANFLNKSSNSCLNKSSNNKSLNISKHNEETIFNVDNQVPLKKEDRSLKETSICKSLNECELDEDTFLSTKTKCTQNNEISIDKSINKSLNSSTKSSKSTNNISIKSISKSPHKDSMVKKTENADKSISDFNLNNNKKVDIKQDDPQNELNLDGSIQKNSERMKFINPVKQNLLNPNNDKFISECEHPPDCNLQLSNLEDLKSSDDNKGDSSNEDINSDIEKEYNLTGKIIEKYSDDDVQGDDCRASEQEFSDSDDQGDDLSDFIVPDHLVTDDEDESEDEQEDDGNEHGQNDESENEQNDESENEQENDKSENEQEYNENEESENNKDHIEIKKEDVNTLNLNKNESVNKSKLNKNESFNHSKSIKEQSIDLSKSIKIKNKDSKSYMSNAKNSVFFDVKKSDASESEDSKSLSSELEDEEVSNNVTLYKHNTTSIVSRSSTSESEDNEDSYHVIEVDQTDPSCSRSISAKTKKLAPLIECSTPKPGVTKENDFSKGADSFVERHSIPITSNKSNSSRRKSGSLNDLSDTKLVSSRLSMTEAASKSIRDTSAKFQESVVIVDSPKSLVNNRQPWKLIPLNQTAHTLTNETPVTKYLKKSKLNDSAPGSEYRKSNCDYFDTLSKNNALKNKDSPKSFKKIQKLDGEVIESPVEKKSKKRKLQDISNSTLINDDNSLKIVKKKKKRAHIEESIIEEACKWEVQNTEPEKIQKNKKKKSHKNVKTEDIGDDSVVVIEDVHLNKKKKKKLKEIKDEDIDLEESVSKTQQSLKDKQKKNKKKEKKKTLDTAEDVQNHALLNAEVKKHQKKKNPIFNEEFEQENLQAQKKMKLISDIQSHPKLKKSKRKNRGSSDDKEDEIDALVNVNFDKPRSSVLITTAREEENVGLLKKPRSKKQKVISNEKTSLKRLPDDVLENLMDEPTKKSNKRQKLSNNMERKAILPSTSMFSPGKRAPANLRVDDDGYMPLHVAGGTTEFGVVNLEKAKKYTKKNPTIMNFRERMLSRNMRQPISTYLMYLKKQKCKNSI